MNASSLKSWALFLFVPALLIFASALIELGGESLNASLRYERDACAMGEGWRWWTGHLAHLGWLHWLGNAAAMLLLSVIFRPTLNGKTWLAMVVIAAPLISAGLWWLSPQLDWYVGLSGLLHTAFVVGLISWLPSQPRLCAILAIVFCAKLAWEWLGADPAAAAEWLGGSVVTAAHRWGAVIGIPFGLACYYWQRRAGAREAR